MSLPLVSTNSKMTENEYDNINYKDGFEQSKQ